MKNIFLVFVIVAFVACNNASQQDATRLPGEFTYTAYNWKDSGDSLGISLLHYLQIAEDGNYRLIQRGDNGNALYYFGFIGYDRVAKLSAFMADRSFKDQYKDSLNAGPTYMFDYSSSAGRHKFRFAPSVAPEAIKYTQTMLDSVISGPGKKQSSFFNIDEYLREIIREDSATRN